MKKIFVVATLLAASAPAFAAKMHVSKGVKSAKLKAFERAFSRYVADNDLSASGSLYARSQSLTIVSLRKDESLEAVVKQAIYTVRAKEGDYSVPEEVNVSEVANASIEGTAEVIAQASLGQLKKAKPAELGKEFAAAAKKNGAGVAAFTGTDGNSFGNCSFAALIADSELLVLESCYAE
jgi:hypothetical protein